jgi:NAD(P)H-dependent FMN reductase
MRKSGRYPRDPMRYACGSYSHGMPAWLKKTIQRASSRERVVTPCTVVGTGLTVW